MKRALKRNPTPQKLAEPKIFKKTIDFWLHSRFIPSVIYRKKRLIGVNQQVFLLRG